MLRIFSVLMPLCVAVFFANPSVATTIDSINASAAPASNSIRTVLWNAPGNDAGWYYTPSFSYRLDGIFTDFGPSNQSLVMPNITVQIQTDRPANGGSLLAQGTFEGNSQTGGVEGASFAPIQLIAGTTYFVDLLNFNGMGVNYGSWQQVGGQDQPSDGATVNLGSWYADDGTTNGFKLGSSGGNYDVTTLKDGSQVNVSPSEPILLFSGSIPTPEPSSLLLLAIGGGTLILMLNRRRAALGRRFALSRPVDPARRP